MKNPTIKASFASTAIIIISVSGSLYSSSSMASEYCSSPKLYATNIRESCNQFGANGMQALYQRSEFINSMIPPDQPNNPAKQINRDKLSVQEAS